MKQNKETQQINIKRVEELLPEITKQRITRARFRFNLTTEDAFDLLSAFYAAEVYDRGRKLETDSGVGENLARLAEYITAPQPEIGVLLCGNVGNGKTTMLKAFQQCVNFLQSKHHFNFFNGSNGNEIFKAEMRIADVRDILRYAKSNEAEYYAVRTSPLLGIDDLGKEPLEVLDYGNVLSPVVDILEYRYDKQLFTFVTSNLNKHEIRPKYGDRVADRMNEMFRKIGFNNPSYRTPSKTDDI